MIEVSFLMNKGDLPGLRNFLSKDTHIDVREKGCKEKGCNLGHYAKGYCQKHYRNFKNNNCSAGKQATIKKGCKQKGCPGVHYALGFCHKHYMSNKHNTTNTKHERKEWNRIKAICSDPDHGLYPRYGGTGVTVCERWLNSFDEFYKDMGVRPSGNTIIDCNGKVFNKNNCRWISFQEFHEDNMDRASNILRR